MHRFTIGQGNNEYTFDVNYYKYLIGSNIETKYQIYSIIKNYFGKVTYSEFAIEDRFKRNFLFDGKALDLKSWRFFEVTPYFDLETDLKMGSKSLMMKYLDSFSDFLDYSDTMNTLSILVNSLNEDFFDNETEINFCDKTIKLQLGNISRNILFKEVYPIISSGDNECNSADLSYEDIIILQLKIIRTILSKSKDKFNFIYAVIPKITKNIELEILGMKYENSFLFIETNDVPKDKVENVSICSSKYLDLANDDMLIDRIMDFPFHLDKELLINSVQNYFFRDFNNYDEKIIIELFS